MSPYSASTRVRGIGVAVITRRSAQRALGGEPEPLVHAEAVLLVDHRERQIGEADLVLEQRVRPDGDRRCGRAPDRRALRSGRRRARARSAAPARDRPAPAARSGRRDAGGPGPRSAPSARPARRPRPRSSMASSATSGLAAADVALEQAQHALGPREVGRDLGQGRAAAPRSDERAGREHARGAAGHRPRCAARVRGARARRTRPSASWLASSSSNASRRRAGDSGADVVLGAAGWCRRAQRVRRSSATAACEPGRILPLRQLRQPRAALRRCSGRAGAGSDPGSADRAAGAARRGRTRRAARSARDARSAIPARSAPARRSRPARSPSGRIAAQVGFARLEEHQVHNRCCRSGSGPCRAGACGSGASGARGAAPG